MFLKVIMLLCFMLIFIHDAIKLSKQSITGKVYAILAILVLLDFQLEPMYPKLYENIFVSLVSALIILFCCILRIKLWMNNKK